MRCMDARNVALVPAPDRAAGASGPLVATLTLGCKLNQAETQALARELEAAGCTIIDRPAPADVYLINTCTVTHVADRKARHLIRMAKRLSPQAPVVVTGCYAERAGERLRIEAGADIVLGNARKAQAGAAVLAALGAAPQRRRLPTAAPGRTRAFLKIQEGCDDVCAFCIVPRVRGRERAVPIPAIVREAQAREAAGTLEVVLTGTQPGAYGRDRQDGTNAAALIEALLTQTTLPRIRYSSIQPQDISPAFLAHWQDSRMCRHFHLALQSGSDVVLQRMRRRYRVGEFLRAVALIRAAVPGAAITTDVIAGFPGEREQDFAESVRVCEEAAFADLHVFPYSARPSTTAALFPDDVPSAAKAERVQRLIALASASAERYRGTLVGSVQSVLVESRRPASDGGANGAVVWRGLTDTYVPVQVIGPGEADLRNHLIPAHIEAVVAGAVRGRVLR